MHATNGPLTGPLKTTTDTTTTRERQTSTNLSTLRKNNIPSIRLKRMERMETSHEKNYKRQPPRMGVGCILADLVDLEWLRNLRALPDFDTKPRLDGRINTYLQNSLQAITGPSLALRNARILHR